MNATNPTDQVQSIFQGEDTMKVQDLNCLLEDVDCGIILGHHDLAVDYRYTPRCGDEKPTIEIVTVKVIIDDTAPHSHGIEIKGMVYDMGRLTNLVFDQFGEE